MLSELEIDHSYLRELPGLLRADLTATDVSALLEVLDINLLIDYQVTLDAIDALLRSTKISPDLQVVRNVASLLFRAMAAAERVSEELEKLEGFVADSGSLTSLVDSIRKLPKSKRGHLETLYETAIEYNPGGWLKGSNIVYGEYSRNVLLLYGLDGLDKVQEIAERESLPGNTMKATNRVVPLGSIGQLTPLKDYVSMRMVRHNLYEEVYFWSEETSSLIMREMEEEQFSG
jgi:hypothetical protein